MQVPSKPYAFRHPSGAVCLATHQSHTSLILRKLRMFIFLVTVLFPALSLGETYRVEKVLDGDTVILDNVERVRLIGVDTTEKSHPFETV
jgi:endonuclease YncB( thermonuclease family)